MIKQNALLMQGVFVCGKSCNITRLEINRYFAEKLLCIFQQFVY